MITNPFNIESPELSPREIEPVEKPAIVKNDLQKLKEKSFLTKVGEDKEKRPLPPDPFGEKGNKIDILG